MTIEEAAEFTRKLLARAEINAFPGKPKRINNIPAFYFYTVLSALLNTSVPDPTTGLMPCGCGGKAVMHECHNLSHVIYCDKCKTETLYQLTPDISKDVWNTAMGYRD